MRRLIFSLAGLVVLIGAVTMASARHWWESPLPMAGDSFRIDVVPGETFSALSARLHAQGIVQRPVLLKLAARYTGADSRIRSGEFDLRAGSSPRDLLALLQSDETVRYQVTLPEGITLARALQLLHEAEGLRAELESADDPRLQALVVPATSTEGYFLPETYQYQRGDTDLDVLQQAHRMMREQLDALWPRRPIGLPLKSPYEALILASIVERETGVAAERGEIAGVFRRRLERGMRLQTDPTVIYGLGASFDGNLTRAHLRDELNPYNTYRHHGLPPGPICLPGAAALRAALEPTPGNTLYFVARGDGTHVFSATLEAHEEAVRAYQLTRRSDYRSAPPAPKPQEESAEKSHE